MHVRLDHTEPVAQNTQTFWFKPEYPLSYVAGQYIEMTLPHEQADERGQKHWFTLSSSPSEKMISITTKHATDRVSTFKQTLFGLKPGAGITVSEAMGDFVLPKDPKLPLLFVAGGIGITPLRSMVKWLSDNHEQRQVHILYGVRTLEEVAFRDIFETYGAKTEIILSDPLDDWQGLAGRLTSQLVLSRMASNSLGLVYVSGPEPMVEKLETELIAGGIDKSRLVLDFFPGYPLP